MNLLMRSFRIDLETAGILHPLAFGLIPTCLRCGLIWMGDAGAGFVGSRGRLHRIIYIWQNGKSPRSWAEAFDVWRSLLGDAGFGCGLHLGLWCGRFLDLHWLSERGLFFAGAGCCCFSCNSPAHAGSCGFFRNCLALCGIAIPSYGCLPSCGLAHGTHVSSGQFLWHRIKPENHRICKHDDICGRRKLSTRRFQ